MARVWTYMVDPSRRVWELYAENEDGTSMQFSEARYDHTQMPFVQETVRFIVDALNAAEEEAERVRIVAAALPEVIAAARQTHDQSGTL